jgi:hypothetical protein
MSIVWIALLAAVALIVVSAVVVTRRGLEAFRAFKQLGRTVGAELDRISATTGEIERHLSLAAKSGGQLEASLARLRSSRARLNVLTSAIADVRAAASRVTGVVPRK